jgi:hypothetical protein
MREVDQLVEWYHFAQLLNMLQVNEMLLTDVDREAVVRWVEVVNHRKTRGQAIQHRGISQLLQLSHLIAVSHLGQGGMMHFFEGSKHPLLPSGSLAQLNLQVCQLVLVRTFIVL